MLDDYRERLGRQVKISHAAWSLTRRAMPCAVALVLVAAMLIGSMSTREAFAQSPEPLQSPVLAAVGPGQGRVIAVDPGHGGSEIGAVHRGADGRADLLEKDVNLAIAFFLVEELQAGGYVPVLTRSTDSGVNVPPQDLNGDGRIDVDDDLQARVDIANEAGAALLLSIHNNGVENPRVRGTSTWYSAAHPLGDRSRVFAELVQAELLAGLRAAGYDGVVDGGANDDPPLGKPYGHLFLVGPKTPRVARVSQMPGVIGESLFVTSDVESQLLKSEAIQRAIAAAYRRAIDGYFAWFAES